VTPAHRPYPEFRNLYKEFEPDDDEMTRPQMAEAFVEGGVQRDCEGLYSDMGPGHMETDITYEDGRVIHIKGDLGVMTSPQ